jgi:hypothetical protein
MTDSNREFIEKSSGFKRSYGLENFGVLILERMRPQFTPL